MKVKTSELTGLALDWAVAACVGDHYVWWSEEGWPFERTREDVDPRFEPSTNWAQGGPIIEREKIAIRPDEASRDWLAEIPFTLQRDDEYWSGPTPLIAAMRCFVAFRLGDEVDVPDELVNPTN